MGTTRELASGRQTDVAGLCAAGGSAPELMGADGGWFVWTDHKETSGDLVWTVSGMPLTDLPGLGQ
jgi:hypothetical protein